MDVDSLSSTTNILQNWCYPNSLRGVTLITSTAALKSFTDKAASQPWVAVDSEFMRRNTYFPRLCIVQLALPSGRSAVVDILGEIDPQPLWRLMDDTRVIKVFHAPGQDLEAFYRARGGGGGWELLPQPMFDTQVAAELGGYGRSLGLGALAGKIGGLPQNGEKDEDTCVSDWSRRPISRAQLRYAINDVLLVREAYLHLSAKLSANGKLGEVAARSEDIGRNVLRGLEPQAAADRLLKRRRVNIGKLTPQSRMALEKLACWRETEAARKDRPRQWIVKDDILYKIACRLPKNRQELLTLCDATPRFAMGGYARRLLEQVAAIRQSA